MAIEFTENGPRFRGILTYSLTANPNSPHYIDQTKMYSQKEWLDIPFNDEDVEAAALEKMTLTEGGSDCLDDGWQEFGQPAFESCDECLEYFESLWDGRITDFVNAEGE
ncbi:MAG: hypothetical protein HOC20_01855 [Chloroflexi bacterium]|nr:hypothetical protein [Chloroflexota bacterium]